MGGCGSVFRWDPAADSYVAFTPDPYLSSVYSYITVKAMGESGLVTCVKHYMAYEQEEVCGIVGRFQDFEHPCSISSEVDDKTLHELYLPSFVETVRAGTGAVMCSYNRINGVFSCENDEVLNRMLKYEMDFQGFVMSDFGASHSTVESAMAGMDMELATVDYYGDNLLKAVKKGKVPEARLDDMVRRILTPFYAQKQHLDYPALNEQMKDLNDIVEADGMIYRNEHVDVRQPDSASYARKAAADSTVYALPLTDMWSAAEWVTDCSKTTESCRSRMSDESVFSGPMRTTLPPCLGAAETCSARRTALIGTGTAQ